MRTQTKIKLNAQKKYWGLVVSVQEEFARQVVHQGLKQHQVVSASRLSGGTVKRFLGLGLGAKKAKPYSWRHGPYATTVFAIADSLGFHFKAVRKNGKDPK